MVVNEWSEYTYDQRIAFVVHEVDFIGIFSPKFALIFIFQLKAHVLQICNSFEYWVTYHYTNFKFSTHFLDIIINKNSNNEFSTWLITLVLIHVFGTFPWLIFLSKERWRLPASPLTIHILEKVNILFSVQFNVSENLLLLIPTEHHFLSFLPHSFTHLRFIHFVLGKILQLSRNWKIINVKLWARYCRKWPKGH